MSSMTSAPTALNLGPNPRRRESFSNSYKPFETATAGSTSQNAIVASNVVAEEAVDDDDDEVPVSPRAFVRGNRSFSQSFPNAPKGIPAPAAPAAINTQQANNSSQGDASMAKSPQEGGWWFGGIKEF